MEPKTSDNRTKIISAAYRVLAEQGYEAATIKEIAKAAKVAPGLLHYYFTNKNELLIEVLTEVSKQYLQLMTTQITPGQPQPDLIQIGLEEPRSRVEKQPEWYRLRYELFALGLRNSEFKPGVGELLESGRYGIRQILQRVLRDKFDETSGLTAILLACFDGLALQKLMTPDFDLDAAYKVLGQMLRVYFNSLEKH